VKGAYEEHKGKGLNIIGLGFQDTESKIKEYVSETEMSWPVGYDTDELIAKEYGVYFGAGLVFIDREGKVTAIFKGAFDETMLKKELDKIL
jgi:alkyl hydroperoxide reductase subunit AhpC